MFLPFVFALVFGGQVALSDNNSFKFNFTTVHQCEPVSISFSGSEINAIPNSLTLIPFGSRPFSISIPSNATNSTGISVSFLPLPANTQFIASLDAGDDNSARVSDIFRVFPSSTGDNSCLPPNSTGTQPYILPTAVSQCEPFTIRYTTDSAPTVRVFAPRGGSIELDPIDDPTSKVATYTMNVTRQVPVVLMAFNDVIQDGMTSNLLTVGGDASSPKSCFVFPAVDSDKDKDKGSSASSKAKKSMSNAVAIGLGVGGGVVLLFAVLLTAFILRRRYQRRRVTRLDFNPALLEKRASYTKSDYSGHQIAPPLNYASYSPAVVSNPPYTATRFSSRSSDAYPVPTWQPPSSQGLRHGSLPEPSASASSYDIEQMLNFVAERNSEDFNKANPPEPPEVGMSPVFQVSSPDSPDIREHVVPATPTEIRGPQVTKRGTPPPIITSIGRHEARPSGVPISAAEDSLTPIGRESFAPSVAFEMVTRPAVMSLTPSPAPRGPSSRFSDPSFLDGGSIGEFPHPPLSKPNAGQGYP